MKDALYPYVMTRGLGKRTIYPSVSFLNCIFFFFLNEVWHMDDIHYADIIPTMISRQDETQKQMLGLKCRTLLILSRLFQIKCHPKYGF